jgi:glycerol-3-phosphate dehydrogenase (NAD(P)+)
MQIAILGAGKLAQAAAQLLQHTNPRLWARSAAARKKLRTKFLVENSLEALCKSSKVFFFAVPAPALDDLVQQYAPFARGDHVILHACRGVAEGFRLPHQVFREHSAVRKIGVLGGPLYISELAEGRIMPLIIASRFEEVCSAVKKLCEGTPIRPYASSDLLGVEIAGAISNVSALAAGMSEALGLGDTARGVLLTHGLAEAARLGAALGASPATFAGLAGVGDLIPRRVTSTDRHHEVGERLARGQALAEITPEQDGSVEGLVTAREAAQRARALGISLPLVEAVASVVAGQQDARSALGTVLAQDLDLGRWLGARP